MSALPKISVIIPFYNRIDATIRAIESARRQTFRNIEIIIVDDGSTADVFAVVDLINDDERCKYIRITNGGPAKARNVGLDISKGEYIAFLDSDDEWIDSKLFIQFEKMQKNGWLFSHTSYFFRGLSSNASRTIECGRWTYFYPLIPFHCHIATPSVVIHRSVVGELRFMECLRVAEDTIFYSKISKRTPLHGINIPLCTIYDHVERTAASYQKKLVAFENLYMYGFENEFLRFLYYMFISFRKIIFKFINRSKRNKQL
ncbi:glycosyltransferase family 2 protein [Bdellovibrio sp. HCB290]|uniref:glycosyltransferase family 2 protein n=1 Tax=Bdellovibrio sp. HCB290 TaxID=3394356 RepID=UPI0039B5D615